LSRPLEIIPLIFIFALKIHFYIKMKIRDTTSVGFDKRYLGHDLEQYSRSFSRRLDILDNTGDTVLSNIITQKNVL